MRGTRGIIPVFSSLRRRAGRPARDTTPPLRPTPMRRLDFTTSDIWVAVLLFAVGLIVAAFAGSTLLGYHNGPALLRPDVAPQLQYDTAWIIVAYGAALLLYAARLRAVAHVFAAAGALIGVLGLVRSVFPDALTYNPLLAGPWLNGAGGFAPMGALTALVALVLGASLAFLVPRAERSPRRAVALAGLASTALALSLLIAFGAWSGSDLASQSLHFSGDERISSLLFVVLSSTVLGSALAGRRDERAALWRAAPIIVWLAAIACVLVVWRAALGQEARFIQHGTQLVAEAAAVEIRRALDARIEMLQRLGERTLAYSFNADLWDADAGSLMRDAAEFRAIAWSGRDDVIKWSTPTRVAVGYDLHSSPSRAPIIDLARQTRQPALSPFADLVSGGKGIVIFVPIFEGDSFAGMVSASLGRPQWLASLIDGRYSDHYFDLFENGELMQLMPADAQKAADEWAYEVPIAIHNARWVLRVTPTQQYVAAARSQLPEAGLALGAALATLLALATLFFQEARLRAGESNRANQRAVADMARRLRAEQKLREVESRTELIINAVKDCAIYMLDSDGRIASWNPGARVLNGYDYEEVIGRPFSILYPPDRKTPPESELAVATRRGSFEEECWHLHKDGSQYCADDVISAIRDEQGALRGFAVVTRDATLRIQLREQTERARDYYLSLFSSFPNLVWRSDKDGSCEYVNQAWLDYTGRSMDAEGGQGWLDGVHADDRAAWDDIVTHTLPTGKPFELEFRLRRVDGEYGSVICSGRPYHDLEGNYAGYLCSCYDNTARRETENALKESEERYERMTTNVPGMVFKLQRAVDGAFRFLYVSQGAIGVTGVEAAALTTELDTFLDLLEPVDRGSVLASLNDSASRLTTLNWAGRLHPKHEAIERWITIRAKPRVDDKGNTLWDGVVFDDTQGRLAQLEIERSREELRALSSHLQTVREEEKAHIAREVHDELGATLTGLRIDLDWLIDHEETVPEPARQKYEAMLALLKAAVAATRKIVTELRPSILDDLGLASALRWQIGEYQKQSDISFMLKTPGQDIPIDRDRALVLFRIFQETITNVNKYAKATQVDVTLSQTDVALVMQIRDNGVGIAEGELHRPTSHGIRGMRERAQTLGGTVAVSGEPGAGTTVIVTLPR
jgi:two-component system, NarL family, sensor histidine kinase UhpB